MKYLEIIRDASFFIVSTIVALGLVIFYIKVIQNNLKISKIDSKLLIKKDAIYELQNKDKRINYEGLKITLKNSNPVPTKDLIQDAIHQRNLLIVEKRFLRDEIQSYKIFNKNI
jgi:hypothetical protein